MMDLNLSVRGAYFAGFGKDSAFELLAVFLESFRVLFRSEAPFPEPFIWVPGDPLSIPLGN